MKNPIAERITDFLKQFHPFSSIEYDDLLNISKKAKIIYLDKKENLFKINEHTHDCFYVIASGNIGLFLTSDTEDVLIDKCFEGDIIGLRPFFAKDNYLMNANAREDSILYAIPIDVFKPIIESNVFVLKFLLQSFASNTRNPYDKNHKGKLLSENIIHDDNVTDIQSFQPIKYPINPITASANDIVKYVAQSMSSSQIGSIIVQENRLPIGIVTDKDLRTKIATGLYSIDVTIDKIMSSPVITVSENLSIAEAQLMMLKNNVSYLCVTKDGTIYSQIAGIISEHDIIVAQANNPGVLLKEIKRAKYTEDLKRIRDKIANLIQNSIDKNIPINHISSIVAEINNAITKKAIELSIAKMPAPPPAKFAWINIGSQGRKEQLLLTDQDNAIIFEDISDDKYDSVNEYFLELGQKVTKRLNEVGFSFCKAEMMANNPKWCKSISDWKSQFNGWINSPREKGISINTIFFDYDFVYGSEKLVDSVTETIFKESKDNQLFYAYLGTDALKNLPPLGFFRQFLVEENGEHKDSFNIKKRAILSLVDAARLLILSYGVRNINNTAARFSKLVELDPKNAVVYESCADAFLTLLKFRTEEGLKNNSDGKYINLNELSKLDKIKLKNTFLPISDVQEIIKNKFQLTFFS